MFGMFFLTLYFCSFLLWMNLGERWCLSASSALALIIPKPSPKYAPTPLQELSSVIWRLSICLVTLWSPCCLICYWGHEDNIKSQLWSPSLSWRAAKSPSKMWLHTSWERLFQLRKSLWAAPSGNTGLHKPIKMEVFNSVMQELWEYIVYMCVIDTWTYVFIHIYIPVRTHIDICL